MQSCSAGSFVKGLRPASLSRGGAWKIHLLCYFSIARSSLIFASAPLSRPVYNTGPIVFILSSMCYDAATYSQPDITTYCLMQLHTVSNSNNSSTSLELQTHLLHLALCCCSTASHMALQALYLWQSRHKTTTAAL